MDKRNANGVFPGHHVWCNEFLSRPARGCPMCSGLREEFAGEEREEVLRDKFFPDVVVVEGDVE